MSSNIKSKTSAKEAPTEPFKRAVAGCLRAIARQPELEVTFAAERPGMAGGKARLPEPPDVADALAVAICHYYLGRGEQELAAADEEAVERSAARRG